MGTLRYTIRMNMGNDVNTTDVYMAEVDSPKYTIKKQMMDIVKFYNYDIS